MIKLLDGYHITSTEKKHITELLKNNITKGGTKTKQYLINNLAGDIYKITIASKYTSTIGGDPDWHKNTIIIKVKENKK